MPSPKRCNGVTFSSLQSQFGNVIDSLDSIKHFGIKKKEVQRDSVYTAAFKVLAAVKIEAWKLRAAYRGEGNYDFKQPHIRVSTGNLNMWISMAS